MPAQPAGIAVSVDARRMSAISAQVETPKSTQTHEEQMISTQGTNKVVSPEYSAFLQRSEALDYMRRRARPANPPLHDISGLRLLGETLDKASLDCARPLPKLQPESDAELLQGILDRQAELEAKLNGEGQSNTPEAQELVAADSAPTLPDLSQSTFAGGLASPASEQAEANAGDKWIDQLFSQRKKMIETLQAETAAAAKTQAVPAASFSGTSTPLIQLDESLAQAAAPPPAKTELDATFMHDVTAPDGLEMAPFTAFEKVWKMKNTGSAIIPFGCQCVFMGGSSFGLAPSTKHTVINKDVNAGEDFEVRIEGLVTPARQGEHMGFWRMMDLEGNWFGDKLWCE